MDTHSNQTVEEIYSNFKGLSARYYHDPVLFVQELFKATPTKQQQAVLQSISTDRKVSVRAGHGVGKSTLASWAVFWFLMTRPKSKVICTAPTFHQLNDILWAEAAMWRQQSELVSQLFEWKQRRIECTLNPAYWWAAARTAEKGESLIGRHAGHFLLIVDEASGVEDHIFEASEGMLTGENTYVLLIGNPTRNVGYFYDSHNKNKKLWSTHVLSCYDCVKEWYPGSPLTGQTYIDEMKYKYGEDSNTFRIKVLGEFPYDEEDALIPHNWIEEAVAREITVGKNEPLVFGIDPGAGGDKTAIIYRRGGKIEKIITNREQDTMVVVGWIVHHARQDKPKAIFIDPIGIGKGAYDRLVELNYRVYPVVASRKARKPEFVRLRDELWWAMRERFENGTISIPNDDDLIRELSAMKYAPSGSHGKIKVSAKKDIRKAVGCSTDVADAINTTWYLDDSAFAAPTDEYDIVYDDEIYTPSFGKTGSGWMRV